MTVDVVIPDPYQKISQISQLFKQTLSSVRSPSSRPTTSKPSSPPCVLKLEVPPDAQAELDDHTIWPELRSVLSESIQELRQGYRRVFDKTYNESLVNLPPHLKAGERFAAVLENRFVTQAVPLLMDKHLKAKQEIARSIQAASTIPSTSSKPFNSAFIPILTTYFLWNPFPPAADKRILAEKGLMSERQIDVWFQNRRAVARKQTGVSLQKAHYKDKAAKGVPADLLKKINEFTSHVPLKGYYGVGLSPDETASGLEKKRKDDEERKWRWATGWGSFGLSGLWERGKVVGRTVIERENADMAKRGSPVDLFVLKAPLPSKTMEEWAAQRKAGEITFDFSGLTAPYSQRTTVRPTPAPPAHIPQPVPTRKDAKASVRSITEMFSDPGRLHFGDLGQKVQGAFAGDEERERSGAATIALTMDVHWYVKGQRDAWQAALEYQRGEGARRRIEQETEREKQAKEEKKEKRRQKEKEKKKRLGEKRTPTAAPRYEPYPTQAQSHVKAPAPSRSTHRSHASSSSISSVSSRTPSLTSNSSASSSDDDDMESLFGGPEPQPQPQQANVKMAVEGFSVAGRDAYGSIGMGMDPNMGYPMLNLGMPMDMGMGYGMDMSMGMGMNMNMGYGMHSMNWGLLPQMGNTF